MIASRVGSLSSARELRRAPVFAYVPWWHSSQAAAVTAGGIGARRSIGVLIAALRRSEEDCWGFPLTAQISKAGSALHRCRQERGVGYPLPVSPRSRTPLAVEEDGEVPRVPAFHSA